ncbi:MAG TPA: molybdopterin-dependent oxidoreductase [Candidatus Cloacimonadota bacterium]|nr:molybdopterin-dependent oxidoreductase [Candidatus Cloacimonadota bacterium]HQL14378.1 molybdopterin-dependent oxidoreductase [Candidatus Cloacimonadota bacterium]
MKQLPHHISGKLHVTGKSIFIGEDRKPEGLLYARFFFSPVAHAKIIGLNLEKAKALPNVTAVLSCADIPGQNQIGYVIKDEPLFPEKEIMYAGQPLAMVLSPYPKIAEQGAKLIELEYEELPAVLSIDEADAKKEWYIPERKIEIGNVKTALHQAEHVISGAVETSAQEHFYLETQRCLAIPGEDDTLTLYSATQSTLEVQSVMAQVLNIPANHIIVDVKRLGGAFGGKERGGTLWACLAGLGAFVTKRPVEVKLNRTEDMLCTGKRHPFKSYYKVGFDASGKISAYEVELLSNGGAYADLSVAILERAMFHAENAYYIPNVRIRGRACRTNLPPNTAFRGFGAPQGIFVMETIIERIAHELSLDPLEVRLRNLYRKGDVTPYGQKITEINLKALFSRLQRISSYKSLQAEVDVFNSNHSDKKQGLATIPVKFGISFTTTLLNQGSALIWIYTDGTVSVTTGGVEMGQEVSTKVAIIVAKTLGISLNRIRVESSNSQRVGNASSTAASTGTDINGNAARIAAEQLKERLTKLAAELIKERTGLNAKTKDIVLENDTAYLRSNKKAQLSFSELVKTAYNRRLALGAYGFYATPHLSFDQKSGKGNPFAYFVCGCALVRVEIDTLTGESKILDAYLVHETGPSLQPDIDKGQIIGAFMQAFGWCTMEDMPYDDKGKYLASSPSTYKIPGIRDLPEKLVVEMVQSPCKEAGALGSKAIGEPPFIYGEAVWFALCHAIEALNSSGDTAPLKFPATPEAILLAVEKYKSASTQKN